MKTLIKNIARASLLCLFFALPAWSAILPPPGDPLSKTYDNFESYSTLVMKYLNEHEQVNVTGVGLVANPFFGTLPGYDEATGSGKLGLNLIQFNEAGPNESLGFQLGIPSATGNTGSTTGIWTTAVDKLLDYLQKEYFSSIPVVVFDTNESGNPKTLDANGYVTVTDPNNNIVKSWYFDAINNSARDKNSYVYVPEDILVDFNDDGVVDFTVTAGSTGSGAMDFLIYAPTLDLLDWDGMGYNINFNFSLINQDNGGEEAWLQGLTSKTPPPNPVPEPTTLLLLGAGLLGLTAAGRRRNSKN